MEFLKYVLSNGSRVHFIDGKFAEPLGITNPSITRHNGKLLMNVRTCEYTFFNYRKNHQSSNFGMSWYPYNINNSNVPVNYYSRNHLCELDDSFNLVNVVEIFPDKFDRKLIYNGAEDIRLSESKDGNLTLSYSMLEADGSISMNIVELDDSLVVKSTHRYVDNSYEKNWMPIMDKPGHYVRMAFGDIVELKDDSFIHHGDANAPLEYRGSSQMIPYKDTYICIVHYGEVYNDNGIHRMSYKHMFIQTDKNYNIIAKSKWFTFCDMPIEFTCGLMIEGDKVLMPFSVLDSVTMVLETNIDLVLAFINGSYSTNNGYVAAYDEFHDIVLRKNGLDAMLSLDKYFISRFPNNAAIRIACLTHLGSYEKNKNAAIDYYVRGLCEVKRFATGMGNNYTHALIGQDTLRDVIDDLLKT